MHLNAPPSDGPQGMHRSSTDQRDQARRRVRIVSTVLGATALGATGVTTVGLASAAATTSATAGTTTSMAGTAHSAAKTPPSSLTGASSRSIATGTTKAPVTTTGGS